MSKTVTTLSPIEVAIDEMETRVKELEDVMSGSGSDINGRPDLKKLQLKLQGSVCVTVNAGPLAYARAFLTPGNKDSHGHSFPPTKVNQLKAVFVDFSQVCELALEWNGKLIASDQHEYHESLKTNFNDMVSELGQYLNENPLMQSLVVHGETSMNSSTVTMSESTTSSPSKDSNNTQPSQTTKASSVTVKKTPSSLSSSNASSSSPTPSNRSTSSSAASNLLP